MTVEEAFKTLHRYVVEHRDCTQDEANAALDRLLTELEQLQAERPWYDTITAQLRTARGPRKDREMEVTEQKEFTPDTRARLITISKLVSELEHIVRTGGDYPPKVQKLTEELSRVVGGLIGDPVPFVPEEQVVTFGMTNGISLFEQRVGVIGAAMNEGISGMTTLNASGHAALDDILAELEQVKAERDEAVARLPAGPPVEGWKKLRKAEAQLGTAREALERIFHHTNNESGEADVARQALTHLEGEGL